MENVAFWSWAYLSMQQRCSCLLKQWLHSKDIQQGKLDPFSLPGKCRLTFCHLPFIMHFNQVTGWWICSQYKPGIYNLIENYFINRNNLIPLYKFMSTMWLGFNMKCDFCAPGWKADKLKLQEWFNLFFPGHVGWVHPVDCCSRQAH